MILYHGSNMVIDQIDLTKSKPNKDFGQGFYLSDNESQAQEMAIFKSTLLGGDPVVSKFEFDDTIISSSSLRNCLNLLRKICYRRAFQEF